MVIYRQDNSYTDFCGQGVTFTLFFRDGRKTTIMAYSPFLVIDGTGYRTEYSTCSALANYANSLLQSGEAVTVLQEPPALDIISDNTCFFTVKGGYSWQCTNPDGTVTKTVADHAHPLECRELLPFETTEPTAAFRFTEKPDAILDVRCWNDAYRFDPSAANEAVIFTDRELTLKPGGYIYEVQAQWNTENGYGGTSSYFFYMQLY